MRETRFVLIRHAESVWNAAGRWQGHADPPLSERGRAQAEALAADLAPLGIEVLLASDLARAAQTASIVGEAIGCGCHRGAMKASRNSRAASSFTMMRLSNSTPALNPRYSWVGRA